MSLGDLLLAHLEDGVPERGLQVRVGDLLDGHVVHQLEVLSLLLLLELVDGLLAVVYGKPVDQFLVVLQVLVGHLDLCLEREDVVFLALA